VAFSVSKSRPFRSLGLYKSSGKHAAPKGSAPASRRVPEDAIAEVASEVAPEQSAARHPAHAATSPRLTSPSGSATHHPAHEAPAAEKTAA
jgi:hypothetical protein